jgi:hypothetical protein
VCNLLFLPDELVVGAVERICREIVSIAGPAHLLILGFLFTPNFGCSVYEYPVE